MKYLEFAFFMLQKGLISIIPFSILYAFSDLNAFFFRHVFRYRVDVVRNNLKRSFPEKSEKEINDIMRKFYRHLIDIMVESIKGYSVDLKELEKRYRFLNIEVANKYFEDNRDIILALSHYGNWEWGSQISSRVFRHSLMAFYKPLSNGMVDRYIENNRAKRFIKLISIDKPRLPARGKGSPPMAYLFISDQNTSSSKAHWVNFLNQDTPCHRGMEVYARQYNLPVIYVDVQRVKRGYYTVELEELIPDPLHTAPGEITERYMQKLEKIIVQKPENWLWSHRRWKRTRQVTA